MKLRTLIIDDEPIALEKLKKYVAKVPFLELAAGFDNPLHAIDFLAQNEVDLIFTDINMPDLNGMEFISSLSRPPMVVFTTAHQQYAVESYRLSAVDYLLKPYSFADFQRAANKALERMAAKEPAPAHGTGSLFVKTDYRYLRVDPTDIRYIKGYGEYLQIYVHGADTPLVTLSSFAAIREKLTSDFLQVHRSYIVNMQQVEKIERNRIVMDSDTYIPVSDGFKDEFQRYVATHAIGRSSR